MKALFILLACLLVTTAGMAQTGNDSYYAIVYRDALRDLNPDNESKTTYIGRFFYNGYDTSGCGKNDLRYINGKVSAAFSRYLQLRHRENSSYVKSTDIWITGIYDTKVAYEEALEEMVIKRQKKGENVVVTDFTITCADLNL